MRIFRILGILVVLSLAVSCVDRHGVIGANFRLRDDSPLPKWLVLPSGVSHDQVNVELIRYEATFNPKCKVRFLVTDKRGRLLQEQIGYMYWHPAMLRDKIPAGTYPNWSIVEVKLTKEVYEQTENNDLLKIVTVVP